MQVFLILTALLGFLVACTIISTTLRILFSRWSIEVFNVEFAVLLRYNAIEEMVSVPFLLMFFAGAQLRFHLELLVAAVQA